MSHLCIYFLFSGSPATFNVVDTNKVTVRGDGLGLVQCGRPAVFVVSAPDANLSDLDVAIISSCLLFYILNNSS